jgi:hypothetical protein
MVPYPFIPTAFIIDLHYRILNVIFTINELYKYTQIL